MDRRGAPAACTILILGIGLQLHRGVAEVVHFGPLFLKVKENSNLTKTVSENVFPVTISSEEPSPLETTAFQLSDLALSIEPTETTEAPLQDDAYGIPSLSTPTSSLFSITGAKQVDILTDHPELYDARSDVIESSPVPLITAVEEPSSQFHGVEEETMTVPLLESFSTISQMSRTTETFQLSSDHGDVATPSLSIESTKSEQVSTSSYTESLIEGSVVASSISETSPTRWPETSPTRWPETSPTRWPETSPTRWPETSPTRWPETSPTRWPETSPTRWPETSPTRWPETSPTRWPETSPTRWPETSPTRWPETSPTRWPETSPTRWPETSPTRWPETSPTRWPVTPVDGTSEDSTPHWSVTPVDITPVISPTSWPDNPEDSTPGTSMYRTLESSTTHWPQTSMEASPSLWPATPVDSPYIPSMTITQEATRYPLYSIFSNLGFLTAQDSTTRPTETLPLTFQPYETSYIPDDAKSPVKSVPESTPSLLQSSVPSAITEPSYTMTPEVMSTQWWSEDYMETVTIKTSDFPGDVPPGVISAVESSTVEVVDSVWSSLLMPSVSSPYAEPKGSSVDFTDVIDSSVTEVLVTSRSSVQSSEMEISSLMPSLLVSSIPASIDLEMTFSTIAISTPFLLESSVYESMNTAEAPAFVPIDSGMYFTPTMSPPEESMETSLADSAYFTKKPDVLFSSLVEEVSSSALLVSSHVSSSQPQDSSTLITISESIFSSSFLEIYSTSMLETISVEAWDTLNPTAQSSFTPPSSVPWTDLSSYISSEFPEMLESTIMPSSILYASSTGATSLLPSPWSPALNATTSALPSSSFDFDHASSALVEEVFPTSTLVPMMTLPPESSHASGLYTSLFSISTMTPPTVSFTPSLSTPPISTISLPSTGSLESTINIETTSMTPTSTVNLTLPPSPQPTTSPAFLPTTPDVPPPSSSPPPITAVGTTPVASSSTPVAVTHNTRDTTTLKVTTTNIATPQSTTATPTSSGPLTPPSGLTATTTVTTTRPSYECDVSNPEPYLVTVVLSRGSSVENITEVIKKTLTMNFRRLVELEVFSLSDSYSFMVTSGPVVFTAVAVAHVLAQSPLVTGRAPPILSLQTATTGVDPRFHVQTVLQFVPQSVDIRLCTFSERLQKGLTQALYEVRRLRHESENFTVQIVNISSSASLLGYWKAPVTVSYAVRERSGFLNGSEVSDHLRNLSLVEFSFFLGFPVKQIAEPSSYPQLNISPILKDSWLQTILLGVQEQHLRDEAFQMEMERKLAQIISEATAQKRRWKRASYSGSNAVQMVNISRLDGQDDPVQLVYFIEDQYGGRLAADKASSLINEVNIQRAAIILGYRLQGAVAQPLNQPSESDRQAQNLWIIVGVAVPVLVVTVIIVILYWKLCRTDKLDFQPDTISNLQQRQKLQAPNVKGFDFAKQHLGQHNKDEVLVVHEPPPPVLHGPLKDSTPSENGDIPTPKSKGSTKPHKIGRHRSSRVTPSDAGSTTSEPSSGKESGEEESPRPSAPPRETKLRPTGRYMLFSAEIPVLSSGAQQHNSASIFEHVDRMSRSSEVSRRLPSKIQLIAMQPMAAPPLHGHNPAERQVEANKIQTTLRHKSEIEHHRNKIRLRAKRKGHYEFPLVDVVGMTDTKERQRMYRRAQMQFDKILDPVMGVPTVFIEPRKSSRSRRSPKQRRKQQGSSSPPDADCDRLITTDSEGTYKRPPGVSNSAYVSDPDLPSDNPTPVSDLGKYPGSPPRLPPAQYVAPQPSIEEVRQTMQSLLDDAFALVAPGTQGPGALTSGGTGQNTGNNNSARTTQGSAPWRGQYTSHQAAHYNRLVDFGAPQTSAPSLMTRSPGFGSGFLLPAEPATTESQQAEGQYPGHMFPEDLPSVARPRPLGSTSGSAQIHQLTQVGIASRMGAPSTELAPSRSVQASSGPGWPSYYSHEDETPRNVAHREAGHSHGCQDYSGPQMYSVNRGPNRQPSSHLPPSICYPSSSAEDIHPGHSSASLIKAIREELLRLSQKQAVAPTYHS
ncbi:UPF0606 protein KIAA1549 homolog isoform X2 [Engystomops pustulosus]|uniref:UPF0606 protein KIAA1549 homolog isoform X2 n=1 Tax=Engystomops pustulosus TaxID=76066 RepID=UPI003AFA848E